MLPRWLISILILCVLLTAAEKSLGGPTDPIARIARVFNRELVQIESRIEHLQASSKGLPTLTQVPQSGAYGFRGARIDRHSSDPTVTIDLGHSVPVEMMYLVPVTGDTVDSQRLFPVEFRIQGSLTEDFENPLTLFDEAAGRDSALMGYPMGIKMDGQVVRYIRMTITRGTDHTLPDSFALAEIVVVSQGNAVSLGCPVTATGARDLEGLWEPRFLTDGRTPIGLWEGGLIRRSDPLLVSPEHPEDHDPLVITLDLGEEGAIDRLHLFPAVHPDYPRTGILATEFFVEISNNPEFQNSQTFFSDLFPVNADASLNPFVLRTQGARGRYLRFTATQPWQTGSLRAFGMAEIQVIGNEENRALGADVSVAYGDTTIAPDEAKVNDNFTAQANIIPFSRWLAGIAARGRVEAEILQLSTRRYRMAEESELIASWGSAVVLGLTFLIPVAIFERKRNESKAQIENLRKRIASDLHDDIGSNLGSISLIARSAKNDLGRLIGGEDLVEDLDEVESIARESSLAMRDIVWLLERRQDTIGDLVQRLRDTASRLLRDTDHTLEADITRTASRLTLDAKRHLFLFVKEALHNIAKHARATQVSIQLRDRNANLYVEISDNGIGLDADSHGRSIAAAKLSDRAKILGGDLSVRSVKDQGTHIFLDVRLAPLLVKSHSHAFPA